MPYRASQTNNVKFESLRAGTNSISNSSIYSNIYFLSYTVYNAVYNRITKEYYGESSYDIAAWWTTTVGSNICIDCNWQSRNQTDNQPYYCYAWRRSSTTEISLVFAVTRQFLVKDNYTRNPIYGATITLVNSNGLSGFWQYTGATLSSSYDDFSDPVSFTVSDGSKISVGDYIRHECYAEVLKVTNVAGNTVTASRAQLGTRIIKTNSGYSNRILKMVGSLSTDSNGKLIPPEAILQRMIYPASGSSSMNGYEDSVITAGYYQRMFFGPYTLKISATGYQNYIDNGFLDPDFNKFPSGPQTIEISLKPLGHPPIMWGA
jgi:hypothetical protein